MEVAGGSGVGNEASRWQVSVCEKEHWNTLVVTAIESSMSCGRLEPLTADAADAKRAEMYLTRGARSARHTRLEAIRAAIITRKILIEEM